MMPRLPIFRLILAALVCAGVCGLNWKQAGRTAEDGPAGLIITEAVHDPDYLFANPHQESLRSVGQPDRAELLPFVFGVDKALSLLPPTFAVIASVGESGVEAKSVLGIGMKNKDPPAA
jgi:hypothetical protein